MGTRIDLEYSAVRLNVVGMVEAVKRAVLPQLAQQTDRGGSRRRRNRNDVDKAAVLVDDADIAEGGRAVGIRRDVQVSVRVGDKTFGLPANARSRCLQVGTEVLHRAHRQVIEIEGGGGRRKACEG